MKMHETLSKKQNEEIMKEEADELSVTTEEDES